MFSYRCPTCGKQHRIDMPFEQSFDAPCLRCREIVHVTPELVYGAAETAGSSGKKGRINERIQPALATAGRPGFEYPEESAKEDVDDPGAIHKGNDAEWAAQNSQGDPDRARVGTFGDDEEESQAGAKGKRKRRKQPSEESPETPEEAIVRRRRQLVTAGIVVLVVCLVGAGGFFGYDAFRKRKAANVAEAKDGGSAPARGKATVSQSKSSASKARTAAVKDKTAKVRDKLVTTAQVDTVEPIIKPRDDKVIRISAARLSSELAADAAAANAKYHAAILEVSGLYDTTESRETVRPPTRPHLLFRCDGPLILCDRLGSKTEMRAWAVLRRDEPCTVRGIYGKDGVLHLCELMPLSPPADEAYRGKDLEVAGYVAKVVAADQVNSFPRIVLEKETFGQTAVECLFRKSDEGKILSVAVGAPIIVRGTCSGRVRGQSEKDYRVRLDNCEVQFTTAPPTDRQRVAAQVLLRAYEQDLYPYDLPPVEGGPTLDNPASLTQLETEYAADPKGFAAKYRHKTMTVVGLSASNKQGPAGLVLTSGDTNGVVAVQCHFSPHALKELDGGPKYVVRGFCSGATNSKTLLLENCELLDPSGQRIGRRLTPDFFPHTPGITLTYDFAQPAAKGQMQVVRLLFELRENGMIETITTHSALVKTDSLFKPGERDTWTTRTKAQKLRLAGYVFRHRVQGVFVELGRFEPKSNGLQGEPVYEPVLKIGAKPGDSWSWSHANLIHEYKLVKFDTYQNRPSAVIEETVISGSDPHHPREISHVYVSGIGEIEWREYQRVTSKERQLVSERRLVEVPRKTR